MRELGRQLDLTEEEKILRNIVSDADKLEALGTICIKRMIEYEIFIEKNTDITSHIRHIQKHCSEKLYLLLTHEYIKTKLGKELGEQRLTEMKNIVDNENVLINFIKEYLKERKNES